MTSQNLRKSVLCVAMGMCLVAMASSAYAANNDGSVVGRVDPGAQVTITSPDTGFTRTVTASNDGSYRFSFLPIGNYTVQKVDNGAPVGQPVQVRVTLGNATTVNLAADDATSLAAVQVIGSRIITPVDVSSTESATNITAEELQRLPVDRNVSSVALLAPGVNKGGASFGGISFGGSSVAENSFYINGLNVTDFYNRNAFSEAPFNFYQEFQVKTGGYSVEFGRTTGGVVNAVAKAGSNEFKSGVDLTFEPRAWQSEANDRYFDGERYLTMSKDDYSQTKLDVWASGAIVKDRLFFFAMYEGRDYEPRNTDDDGETLTRGESDDGFWGGTVDWNITDNNTLSLMAFSNKDSQVGNVYDYDFDNDELTLKTNEIYTETGGDNWALSWTSYFTSNLSMKLMYGESNRQSFTSSLNDIECNRVVKESAIPSPGVPLGCTTSSTVYNRDDTREQARADFEWSLGDHLLRFGLDREVNTSELDQRYPGPGAIFYNVYSASAGSTIPNPPGGVVPPGYSGYVRARRNEISGNFETDNSAWYIEDNWSVTDNLILNLGLRQEAFDNKDAAGRSYIKMDDMIAPRFGFSWDMKGDGTTKFFGNAGRYFLPVANVINIKQAGGLLDERTYYAFDGWEIIDRNGGQYAVPRLGPQIGTVDVSQGDGTVGDLRSEVDSDMDPVYQDEAILGFQSMINDTWSWGVRGIYRKLNNAIDDMEISATGACGEDGYIGWVMANPGEDVTVWGDTNCDGDADGWVTVDTSREGWAMYRQDGVDADGDPIMTYIGQRGWEKPKRTYKALEFQIDRAWDDRWALNAAYTLAWSEGNAEGPVNSDTNFADTGRTENFDDPWVNLGGNGPLANDHRHQLKLRGTYAFNDNWQVGATVDARSGGPVTGFGVGNPFDAAIYHSYYVCVENCDSEFSADRIYQHSRRGGEGRMPWTYELGANVTYLRSFGSADLRVKFSVFNLFNQQREIRVDQELQPSVGMNEDDPTQPQLNEFFNVGYGFQAPRYAQLVVSVSF
jgi:outer membrane receptor for ferrienterochelin and colicin